MFPNSLIDDLVDDLSPVRPLATRDAWLVVAVVVAAAAALLGMLQGFRTDIIAGHPSAIVLLRGGMLALLGFAALGAALASARPTVGSGLGSGLGGGWGASASHGWQWALAAAALFPIVTVAIALSDQALPLAVLTERTGPWCLFIGGGFGIVIAGATTLWLRRGASMRPERTGMLTGLGSGAFGTMVFSLSCVSDSVAYTGIWYSGSILICTIVGRLVIPPLLRW